MSKNLQDILDNVHAGIEVFKSLPKKKRHRTKYWDAYIALIRLEWMIQEAIEKHGI